MIRLAQTAKRDHRNQQHDVPGDCPRSAARPSGRLNPPATPPAEIEELPARVALPAAEPRFQIEYRRIGRQREPLDP